MSDRQTSVLDEFQWSQQPGAERFVREQSEKLLAKLPWAAGFSKKLHELAAVRFNDLIDTICLPTNAVDRDGLALNGWTRVTDYRGWTLLDNELGMFPTIALASGWRGGEVHIHLKVESVADFLATNDLQREIIGKPLARYRYAEIENGGEFLLAVAERHGHRGFFTEDSPAALDVLKIRDAFRIRPRDLTNESEAFDAAMKIVDEGISKIGRGYTCDLFFAAEREYWMKRNHAGRSQKARQDKLGIGWANHDHHTYRSSRENFPKLVAVFEKLGFHCRERFYAGLEAGWGAQVMEDPATNIITFNDVDMSPAELMGDFSHAGFSEKRDKLGTVGLWCGLHGEAFNQAGMHHLEAIFDFEPLKAQLEKEAGVKMMKPFTDFSYLRQAFTEGERWPVSPKRVARLQAAGYITAEQAAKFVAEGAIGSHLENLERNDGFKGFNQKGVSEIIAATDPRKQQKLMTA